MSSLDLYLNTGSDNFTIESLAILLLLDYCEVKNDQIKIYCVYTDHECLSRLKTRYRTARHAFVDFADAGTNPDVLQLNLKEYSSCSKHIRSVSFPIAVTQVDSTDLINTGLATIYRVILKHLNKLQNNCFKKLLVGYTLMKKFIWSIRHRRPYSKRATSRPVSKHVPRFRNGLICAKPCPLKYTIANRSQVSRTSWNPNSWTVLKINWAVHSILPTRKASIRKRKKADTWKNTIWTFPIWLFIFLLKYLENASGSI